MPIARPALSLMPERIPKKHLRTYLGLCIPKRSPWSPSKVPGAEVVRNNVDAFLERVSEQFGGLRPVDSGAVHRQIGSG